MTLARIPLCIAFALIGACTSPARPARTPVAPAAVPAASPRALAGLADATRALGGSTAAGARRDVGAALTALAAALDRAGAGVEADQITALAAKLTTNQAPVKDEVDVLRRALDTAGQALETRARAGGAIAPELTAALAAAESAMRALDPKRGLADQRPRVVAAFEATTDAVYLLHRRRAPFPLVIASGDATRSPADALAAARHDALVIARAPWIAGDVGTGAFVRDLADMLSARDDAKVREGVAGLRLDAQRLSSTDAPVFDRAARLKRALRAALDLLAPMGVDPMWITDARDAVAAIDPHGDIAFQRGEVQDAIRATVAAFAAADLAPRAARTGP